MSDSVATAAGQGAPAAGVQLGGAAGNSAAPAGQGAAQQGSPTAGSNGDGQFNWGLFPGVPEEARELVEPHLRTVQGHVTRMEMENAPYKPLTALVGPDQVENLVGFINAYGADAPGTVLGLVQQGIQDGSITADQVAQLTQGAPAAQTQAQPADGEQIPQWAQELQQRLAQQDAAEQQRATQQAEAEQAQIMEQAKTNIRAQLTQGGIDESLVNDQMIVAAVIAHNGDEQAAANSFIQLRQGLLGAFTNEKTTPGKQPTQRGQVPKPAAKPGRRGDGLAEAKSGARAFLEQRAEMAGSG